MKINARRIHYIGLFAALLIVAVSQLLASAETPSSSRPEILDLMKKVDAWQTAHPVMPANDRNWERGTWYTGVMAAWEATHDTAFLNQALAWGRQNGWQFGTEPHGANRLFCVQTWAELYLDKKDPQMIAPAVRWIDTKDEFSPAGAKRWYLDKGIPYVDSLYGAAALAMLAKATGRQQYLTVMDSFFDDVTSTLLDPETGLYYRDPTFIGKKNEHGKKILWSRGNGWAFAGIARILEYLPENDPRRKRYVEVYKRMAAQIVARQSSDGMWRPNLDDATLPANPESSGTAFFTFGLAWGIRHNILDRTTYLPPTQKAFAALVGAISPEGKVQWGQLVDAGPNASTKGDTHEYVTGAFLLAASEAYRLELKTH